jgi:hypothetical protein
MTQRVIALRLSQEEYEIIERSARGDNRTIPAQLRQMIAEVGRNNSQLPVARFCMKCKSSVWTKAPDFKCPTCEGTTLAT